jgi:hypothetical protein
MQTEGGLRFRGPLCIFSITGNSPGAWNDERKCPEIYGRGLFQDGISILALVA